MLPMEDTSSLVMQTKCSDFTVQTVQLVTLSVLPTQGSQTPWPRQRLPVVPMITISIETWTPTEQELNEPSTKFT